MRYTQITICGWHYRAATKKSKISYDDLDGNVPVLFSWKIIKIYTDLIKQNHSYAKSTKIPIKMLRNIDTPAMYAMNFHQESDILRLQFVKEEGSTLGIRITLLCDHNRQVGKVPTCQVMELFE